MRAADRPWAVRPERVARATERRELGGWVIPTDAVRAVGRFNPDGVEGYRA